MANLTSSRWLVGLVFTVLGFTSATAQDPKSPALDCSIWTLDGYRLGMRGDELLAVRSVTLHVEGQAQVIEPGKLRGVLVLDALNRLEKWDAIYDHADRDGLHAELKARFGEPTSDVSGDLPADESDAARQRRTIWWSTACDAAIIVHDNSSVRGAPVNTVSATLARASILPPGLATMKTLFP